MPISPPFTEADVRALRGYAVAMKLPYFGAGENWSLRTKARIIELVLDLDLYDVRVRKGWNEACLYPRMRGVKPLRIDAELFSYMKEHGRFLAARPEQVTPVFYDDTDIESACEAVLTAINKGYELWRRSSSVEECLKECGHANEWILLFNRGPDKEPDVWAVDPRVIEHLIATGRIGTHH